MTDNTTVAELVRARLLYSVQLADDRELLMRATVAVPQTAADLAFVAEQPVAGLEGVVALQTGRDGCWMLVDRGDSADAHLAAREAFSADAADPAAPGPVLDAAVAAARGLVDVDVAALPAETQAAWATMARPVFAALVDALAI